jgi:HK97 family phage prohead protease
MEADVYRFFEIKEVAEDGTFRGVASVYGEEDLGGDVVDKGAFKKTISENPVVPILWQHKSDEVIGEGNVSEWQGKIMIDGRLDMDDPTAQKAHRKMRSKLVKGLSIGFNTVKSSFEQIEGRLVRHISELKLWEVSIVTFPMLLSAQVMRVKQAQADSERITSLEKQVQALLAKSEATPEGAGKSDEAAVVSDEPEVFHSWVKSFCDEWKAGIQTP